MSNSFKTVTGPRGNRSLFTQLCVWVQHVELTRSMCCGQLSFHQGSARPARHLRLWLTLCTVCISLTCVHRVSGLTTYIQIVYLTAHLHMCFPLMMTSLCGLAYHTQVDMRSTPDVGKASQAALQLNLQLSHLATQSSPCSRGDRRCGPHTPVPGKY